MDNQNAALPSGEAVLTLKSVRAKLLAPFPPDKQLYRAGKYETIKGWKWTRPLTYIDARLVCDRLDDVVGPDNWESDIERLEGGAVICRLTVLGKRRSDVGMVNRRAVDKQGEVDLDAEVLNEKGSVSDAIKRAAVQFGIGRYLYGMELPLTPLVPVGNRWVLPDDYLPPEHGGSHYDPATFHGAQWMQIREGKATKPAPKKAPEAPRDEMVTQFESITGDTVSKGRLATIHQMLKERGLTDQDARVTDWLKKLGKPSLEAITNTQASNLIDSLKKINRSSVAAHGG